MGGSGACAGVRAQLGVYLTGAIHPADRAVVVRHLASCAICRAELAGLSALPALLRRPASRDAAEDNRVGGTTVLTDAVGYTLYWFGPDSPAMSACVATCARAWPPVTAPAVAGAGVNGTLGAIARPDGSLQATYDGHPLYTASADMSPGQAKGNGVWSDGGLWHAVVVSGPGPATASPSDRDGQGY
jgi:predicted lipoprotein with Yx(FWY)xxD motif